ncbi:DUF3152 domain-containing protein [Streptomyces sp. NPDC048664]|uniref:DUF3152 domain-containing protein n=1 Tax=Streptomyces sp. NPDC048664 TaxID=3154505 RepID=UPI00343D4286
MGRHSRKGRGSRTDTDTGAVPAARTEAPAHGAVDDDASAPRTTARGARQAAASGAPRPSGAPAAAQGRVVDVPTPARGVPRAPDGTPARGIPRLADGTPSHGVPRVPDADGGEAGGAPRVRGGHPQQRESGGGWGELGDGAAPAPASSKAATPADRAARIPRQRSRLGGPRQEYVDAFDDDVFTPRRDATPSTGDDPARTEAGDDAGADTHPAGGAADGTGGASATETGQAPPRRGGRGRTIAGIGAAAVVTVLALVVAGQFTGGAGRSAAQPPAGDRARDVHGVAPQGSPSAVPGAEPLTYARAMAVKYPLSATLKGPGTFSAVPGSAKAPGTGRKYTYRVDVEDGLGLDGELFAQAVQKTLNDDRSWAHQGARTFERVSTGKPDFVITLASPGTTAFWCAKSDLDTAEENVSCDSASTERVMINAYRWAQGSKTYGDAMYSYRQMLINHEVGHRLGHGHVSCQKDGELAPVMQQQTKFLDHDGIHCLPNPWPFPRG